MKRSSNKWAKVDRKRADKAWTGDNMHGAAFGFDDIFSGKPFGVGEFGGVDHFKNVTQNGIDHKK